MTRADATFVRLRADILNGHHAPGAKLAFADLSGRYGVSTGVLREVLPRLVEQGLATTEPQLGYRVVAVSPTELRQLTDARVAVEGLVLRRSIGEGDLAWEAGVVAAHHALVRTPNVDDAGDITPDWLAAHEAYHLALLGGCRNRHLLDTAGRLRAIAEVYRCWAKAEQLRVERDVAAEHRALASATIARDADRATDLLAQHIHRTADLLLAEISR